MEFERIKGDNGAEIYIRSKRMSMSLSVVDKKLKLFSGYGGSIIFDKEDLDSFIYILTYWDEHNKLPEVPNEQYFEYHKNKMSCSLKFIDCHTDSEFIHSYMELGECCKTRVTMTLIRMHGDVVHTIMELGNLI